jgi:hypothetical protein
MGPFAGPHYLGAPFTGSLYRPYSPRAKAKDARCRRQGQEVVVRCPCPAPLLLTRVMVAQCSHLGGNGAGQAKDLPRVREPKMPVVPELFKVGAAR